MSGMKFRGNSRASGEMLISFLNNSSGKKEIKFSRIKLASFEGLDNFFQAQFTNFFVNFGINCKITFHIFSHQPKVKYLN